MIRKIGLNTYKDAVREAEALLWESRDKSRDKQTTTEHTRKGVIPFSYIEDEATGATVYIYSLFPTESYGLTFLTADEAKPENRTLPYRDLPKETLDFLMVIRTPIFKPVREIIPDEALSPDGVKAIYALFGDYLPFTPIAEVTDFDLGTAFEYWESKEEVGSLLLRPYPQELTERTGIAIKKPSDYAKALAKAMGVKMDKEQAKRAAESYSFFAAETLLRYAIYEFFRTEKYNRLKEILSSFAKFALPENWEENSTLSWSCYREQKVTAEEYVIAKYLSNWQAYMVGSRSLIRLKEVAEYTGTPLGLMSRANQIERIFDF